MAYQYEIVYYDLSNNERRHFQWLTDPTSSFKVTLFFDAESQKRYEIQT